MQDSVGFAALENNVAPLIRELTRLECNWKTVGLLMDSQTITGEVDWNDNLFVYGSSIFPEVVQNKYKNIGYDPGLFDPRLWHPGIPTLNPNPITTTLDFLYKNWPSEPRFIKSVLPKRLTGQVIEPEEQKTWLEEHEDLERDIEICISPLQIIDREWRFFIVGGKLITGSLYKWERMLRTNEPISKQTWQAALYMANKTPAVNIVMDIAEVRNKGYFLLEYNSIHSSGFYRSDISKIAEAINAFYDNL